MIDPDTDTPAVLVIGDVMLDIIAAPHGPIALASDTPATITLQPGGSAANTAAWLAHFDNDVRLVARVGHDTAAEHTAALRALGITPQLAQDRDRRTGTLVTLLSDGGERSFLTDRGANARLCRADLPDSLLDDITHVHVSGYALFESVPRAAVLDFLRGAAERDIPISVDPGSESFLRAAGSRAFLGWTNGARLCFPNMAEAAALCDATSLAGRLTELGRAYETLVITDGARGASATTAFGKYRWSHAAPQVEAVDTTGAGDAFVAGFLTAHLRGLDIHACLRAGVAAGSAAVGHFGGRPSPATP